MNIGYNGNKRELYINAPGESMNIDYTVLYSIGFNHYKRELYINVPRKDEYWL